MHIPAVASDPDGPCGDDVNILPAYDAVIIVLSTDAVKLEVVANSVNDALVAVGLVTPNGK